MSGFWFIGLSGVGKSFASEYLNKNIKKSVKVDGDQIRKFISYDLGYTLLDRKEQIRRVLGIAKFLIFSNFIPIISTVYMNKRILEECKKNDIKVLKIKRSFEQIKNKSIYKKNIKNVVGKDISMPNIKTKIIENSGCKKFYTELNKLMK
jgi:adenylylsulfate kinase-like enzyme